MQLYLHLSYSVLYSWSIALTIESGKNSISVQPGSNTISLLSFWRSLIDLLRYFALQCYFDSVLFYTCNVWILLVCHELKEFSFLFSGFWLLLKTKSKHYLTQQRLWWKFLLEAALSQMTVGIVFGFWYVTLCQNLGNYPLFAFVLLHFIWAVPCKMCIILI